MDTLPPTEQAVLTHAMTALAHAPPSAQLRVAAALVQDAAYRSARVMPPDRLVRLVGLAAELDRLARA